MKIDLMIVAGGIVAAGLAMWAAWSPPPRHGAAPTPAVQRLAAGPELKAITERSPYMRTER